MRLLRECWHLKPNVKLHCVIFSNCERDHEGWGWLLHYSNRKTTRDGAGYCIIPTQSSHKSFLVSVASLVRHNFLSGEYVEQTSFVSISKKKCAIGMKFWTHYCCYVRIYPCTYERKEKNGFNEPFRCCCGAINTACIHRSVCRIIIGIWPGVTGTGSN